jgi:hypothetical protein
MRDRLLLCLVLPGLAFAADWPRFVDPTDPASPKHADCRRSSVPKKKRRLENRIAARTFLAGSVWRSHFRDCV